MSQQQYTKYHHSLYRHDYLFPYILTYSHLGPFVRLVTLLDYYCYKLSVISARFLTIYIYWCRNCPCHVVVVVRWSYISFFVNHQLVVGCVEANMSVTSSVVPPLPSSLLPTLALLVG